MTAVQVREAVKKTCRDMAVNEPSKTKLAKLCTILERYVTQDFLRLAFTPMVEYLANVGLMSFIDREQHK